MKKFLAFLLAAMMLLGCVAVAEEGATSPEAKESQIAALTKVYVNAMPDGDVLNFTITPVGHTYENLFTVESNNSRVVNAEASTNGTLSLLLNKTPANIATLPYGSYKFIITEDSTSPYVTETANTVAVLLVKERALNANQTAYEDRSYFILSEVPGSTSKSDSFTNTYNVGSMTIEKTLSGNMADPNAQFSVRVGFTNTTDNALYNLTTAYTDAITGQTTPLTFTSMEKDETVTLTLTVKGGSKFTISNIPLGVDVTVTETNAVEQGYTATYTVDGAAADGAPTVTIDQTAAKAVVINNHKDQNIPTGVYTDTLPYVLLIGVAVLAVVAVIVKRRLAAREDD